MNKAQKQTLRSLHEMGHALGNHIVSDESYDFMPLSIFKCVIGGKILNQIYPDGDDMRRSPFRLALECYCHDCINEYIPFHKDPALCRSTPGPTALMKLNSDIFSCFEKKAYLYIITR